MILNDEFYNSPTKISAFLAERSISPQKRFGQNFLINQDVRLKIAQPILAHNEIKDGKEGGLVWEIGPGMGAETALFLKAGFCVRAFEIDRGFCALLKETFAKEYPDLFKLTEGDVMQTWKKEGEKEKPRFLLGNLPYNIAASLICAFIENGFFFERCVITVQKEVAARMLSSKAGKNYSSLSVLCGAIYDISVIASLKPQNFYPRPNVDSAALLMVKKDNINETVLEKDFFPFVRAMFASRRKTVKNNLSNFFVIHGVKDRFLPADEAFLTNKRAEDLDLNDFLRLYKLALARVAVHKTGVYG